MASESASFRQRDGPVLALFFALTLLMTNPLVLHLANAVEDKQDSLLNTWIIAWVGHALSTDPLHLFDANIFYPYRNTLAFSEVLLPQGLLALPINFGSGNTILGYNLVLLFSFLLAAYGMYLLVFDLTRQRAAGVIAGTIFAFNPFNLGNLAQVQLLSFGWLPLALLSLRRTIINSQRTTNNWQHVYRDSLLFSFFFSLQILSSIYYGLLAALAVTLYLLWSLITNRASRFTDHASRIRYYASLLVRLSISAVIIAVLVVPILLPYLQVQRELGFERKIEESEQFSASLKLFAEVSARNVIYGSFLSPRPPIMAGGYPQDNLFPGFVAVGLAIAGIIASRNRERWFYFGLLLFAFVLSLGPRLYLTPTDATSILLPYRWLYDGIPLTHALRAPVRFDALVMLALAVLAGMGMQGVGSRQQAEGRRQKAESLLLPLRRHSGHAFAPSAALRACFCLLICLEYFALPAANITPVPVGDAIPAYVRWLGQQPRGTVLELPMMGSECACSLDLTTQYLSTYHWQRTPDGYSGFYPRKRGEIAYEMQFFPDERAIALLRALGVQYVISHNARPLNSDEPRFDFQLVERFGKDLVYQIVPGAYEPPALGARIYLPQPAAPNENYTAYVILENHARRSFAVKPTDALRVEARWSDGTNQNLVAALPLVTSSISIVPVRLLAPRSEGIQRLELYVLGTDVGEWSLSGDVAVQAGDPAREVVVPVRVELAGELKPSYLAGESVSVDLLWLGLNKIDAYYSVSVRIVDARGNKIAWEDREPKTSTLLWTPKWSIPDRFVLVLPRNLSPGEYSVQVLMYQANLGLDALMLDRDLVPRETIELGKFTVQ